MQDARISWDRTCRRAFGTSHFTLRRWIARRPNHLSDVEQRSCGTRVSAHETRCSFARFLIPGSRTQQRAGERGIGNRPRLHPSVGSRPVQNRSSLCEWRKLGLARCRCCLRDPKFRCGVAWPALQRAGLFRQRLSTLDRVSNRPLHGSRGRANIQFHLAVAPNDNLEIDASPNQISVPDHSVILSVQMWHMLL